MAIKRIWHGWTTPENATAYENLLRDEVFPGIEAKQIPGYRGIDAAEIPILRVLNHVRKRSATATL